MDRSRTTQAESLCCWMALRSFTVLMGRKFHSTATEKYINALKQLIKGKYTVEQGIFCFFFSVLLQSSERVGTRQSIMGQGKRWETTNNRPFCCSSLWWKDPEERCLGVKHFTQNQSHHVYVGSYFPNSKLTAFFTGWYF